MLLEERDHRRIVESFRDWGQDCWCEAGHDNTCHKRFGWHLGALAQGFDQKYTCKHVGYNLKPWELQGRDRAGAGREAAVLRGGPRAQSCLPPGRA